MKDDLGLWPLRRAVMPTPRGGTLYGHFVIGKYRQVKGSMRRFATGFWLHRGEIVVRHCVAEIIIIDDVPRRSRGLWNADGSGSAGRFGLPSVEKRSQIFESKIFLTLNIYDWLAACVPIRKRSWNDSAALDGDPQRFRPADGRRKTAGRPDKDRRADLREIRLLDNGLQRDSHVGGDRGGVKGERRNGEWRKAE